MEVVLDLYNFDTADAEGSKYVLTSPRSLEACSRLKTKPVELLQKSHADFSQENVGKPIELIQILYQEWDEKRLSLLQKCRQEREKIIMEQQIAKKKEKKRNLHVDELKTPEMKSNSVHRKPTRSIFNSSPSRMFDSPHDGAKPSTLDNSLAVIETNRSRHMFVNKSDGLRSRSVENDIRQKSWKTSGTSSRSLFGNNSTLSSGYITPQIQRDRRLVELMKERRRQDEKEEKERRNIVLNWSKEQKHIDEIKRKEVLHRHKELASSHLAWERKLKQEESKKSLKLRTQEEEKLHKQEQSEAIARLNIEKQEKLRLHQIEERKKIASEKKQKQEKCLNVANSEVMAYQKAIEEDIKTKQEKASRAKLETEVKELQKVKLMNRKQQERILEIQTELKRRQEADEEMKRKALGRKLDKAAENYTKNVISRDISIKSQGRQINEKIDQTKKNLKRLDREAEEYKHSIVVQKNEKTQKATGIAQETALSKAIRAKEIRAASEGEWKKNLQLIRQKDKQLVEKMKESLVIKEDKVKRHVQLKEAALEFSRVQAKINEAERELLKRKSTNFHQMAQKAKLSADIGRGPRSSFVNFSTVKLG